MGGSSTAPVFKQLGSEAPDVNAAALKAFWVGCQLLRRNHPGMVLAYHDRSDGGLFTTIAEMCFGGRAGVEIFIDAIPGHDDPVAALFNEELGAVLQVRESDVEFVRSTFMEAGLLNIHAIGIVTKVESFSILHKSEPIYETHCAVHKQPSLQAINERKVWVAN